MFSAIVVLIIEIIGSIYVAIAACHIKAIIAVVVVFVIVAGGGAAATTAGSFAVIVTGILMYFESQVIAISV